MPEGSSGTWTRRPLPKRLRRLRALTHHENAPALAIVTACIVIVNVPTLIGVVTTNPLQLFASLQSGPSHQVLQGFPTIDPNAGFVTMAFGHLAASSWLHGHVPWWNLYEGIGSPLAGEMQSAALFPLTLLLEGTWGFVPFHLILELIAGWSTFFLLRRMGSGRLAATTAGVAFGLCGTFAWFGHAPANPVAFLPLSLLAVERCLDASHRGSGGGWVLLGLALALSALAGFPEVAYLDGLLVALWTVVRLAGARGVRGRFATKLVGGGLLGGLLAAPILVAFADYLPNADVGGHSGAFGNAFLVPQSLPALILPYVYGPIFALHSSSGVDVFNLIWGNVGGYLTAALVVCALVGLLGRRLRGLRIALGAWTGVALAKVYGLSPIAAWVLHIPLLRSIATYRYSPPSWELAVVVLAGLGIDDIARRRVHPLVPVGAGVLTIGAIGWAMAYALPLLTAAVGSSHRHIYDLAGGAWAIATVVLVTGGAVVTLGRRSAPRRAPAGPPGRGWRRWAPLVMGATVCVDCAVLFAVPLLSAPTPAPVDLSVVHFLQDNLGLHRIATLGPLQPDFGSYFGIAEVNDNDVPIPKSYGRYVEDHLDPNTDPLVFTGTVDTNPAGPSQGQELTAHLAGYEAIGVKYVLVNGAGKDSSGIAWPPPSLRSVVKLVYFDADVRVYQLPDPAPLFSTVGSQCKVTGDGWDAASVSCPRPAVLVRRELSLPGWSARIGNRDGPVGTTEGIFQSVSVPAGASSVVFTFSPPHLLWAVAAFVVGVAAIVAASAWALFRRRRTVVATTDVR